MSATVTHTRPEGGMRRQRVDFHREAALGQPDDENRTFHEYSPILQSFNWTPDAEPAERRAIGHPDPVHFDPAAEAHDVSVSYDMTRWFVDGGDADDAVYDALFRDIDNIPISSHTVVGREEKEALNEALTVDGDSGARATRIYTVTRGAQPAEAEVIGDASETASLMVELSYRAQSSRSYQIDQPDADVTLQVVSDNAADDAEVTVEDEGGNTSETVALDGETPVVVGGVGDFDDVDAFELSAETDGTVTLQQDDGTDLAVIHGKDAYPTEDGDLGVPALLGGSRDAAPTDTQRFLGAEITRAGSPLRNEIPSATLRVSNETEEMERATTREMGIYAGDRELELEATMFGENATHQTFDEYLRIEEGNVVWHLSGGDVTLEDAVYFEPGERAIETSQAVLEVDATFRGTSLSVN